MCQFGADAWAVPSKTDAAWASRGYVHTLLSHCMCQEGDVLVAVARVMREGVREGQLAQRMPPSVLSTHVVLLRAWKLIGPKRAGSKRDGCIAPLVAAALPGCARAGVCGGLRGARRARAD
eukprot:6036420-Pleurochrysis_carterae.AAC.1